MNTRLLYFLVNIAGFAPVIAGALLMAGRVLGAPWALLGLVAYGVLHTTRTMPMVSLTPARRRR